MLIENNTLKRIDPEDVIDGVFVAPDDVLYINDFFRFDNVVKMILPNVIEIGSFFTDNSSTLEYLEMSKIERIGSYFTFSNKILRILLMPNVTEIGYSFMRSNEMLSFIDMPNIKEIGGLFLPFNTKFNYTSEIIKSLKGELYIGGEVVKKSEYLRKIKMKKLLC